MNNRWSLPINRQRKITELMHEKGHVRVNELGKLFGVSEITIRRDLDVLEGKGFLERIHGGALPLNRLRQEMAFARKSKNNIEIKKMLAKITPSLIEENDLICINSGSTMRAVLAELINENITIFTNNVGGLQDSLHCKAKLNVLGGYLRPESLAIVGPATIQQLESIYPTKTILGVDGFNIQSGLTSPNELEAQVSKKMIMQTRGDIILIADHSKIGIVSSFAISGINNVSTLVCDASLDPNYRQAIEKIGIKLIICGQDLQLNAVESVRE